MSLFFNDKLILLFIAKLLDQHTVTKLKNQSPLNNDDEQSTVDVKNEEEIQEENEEEIQEENEETPLCSICLQCIGEFEIENLRYSWYNINSYLSVISHFHANQLLFLNLQSWANLVL